MAESLESSTKIRLRPLLLTDAVHYARLLGDDSASIQMTATHPDPCTEEAARFWLANRLAGEDQMFAITRVSDGEVVGVISMLAVADTHVVGYWVGRIYSGLGYATMALRLLIDEARQHGPSTLLAETFPENVASQRVLLKAGFVFVGEDARHFPLRGGWRTVNQYELQLR